MSARLVVTKFQAKRGYLRMLYVVKMVTSNSILVDHLQSGFVEERVEGF